MPCALNAAIGVLAQYPTGTSANCLGEVVGDAAGTDAACGEAAAACGAATIKGAACNAGETGAGLAGVSIGEAIVASGLPAAELIGGTAVILACTEGDGNGVSEGAVVGVLDANGDCRNGKSSPRSCWLIDQKKMAPMLVSAIRTATNSSMLSRLRFD